MKIITQKQIAQRVGLDPSFLSKIMAGKSRPSATKAAELEVVTGIGIRTWLFGRNVEIRRELERAYGRLPLKKEAKK